MSPNDMEKLAERMFTILREEFGIPAHKMLLNMTIDSETYDTIKPNFLEHYPFTEIVLTKGNIDWGIIITREF
jgi:hypothetical protein